MRTGLRPACIGLALLCALAAPAAHAQPAAAIEQAKAEARVAADKGMAHYNARRYQEALAAFRQADNAFHAPTFVLMIARAHAQLGRLREATAYYRRVIDEELTHYAPRVFFEAQAAAKKELEELIPRIPVLHITVTGAPPDLVELTLDGRPATLGKARRLDPGDHRIVAAAPGREWVAKRVVLRERDNVQMTLELSEVSPPGEPAPDAQPRGTMVPAIAAFGVAGVAMGIGAVTGALTFGRAGSLEDECPGGTCYDDAGGDSYDSAATLGTVSTVSFILGAVAAGAGVVLLVLPYGKEGATTQAGVRVGPGWASVRGVF